MSKAIALGTAILIPLCLGFTAPTAKNARLDSLLHSIEQRYNRAKTLSVHFEESYVTGKHVRRTESGTLRLRKPGKMLWSYDQPAGKTFLADGKRFYLYTPSTQKVEVTPARESEDLHAPLAFLLGHLNFYKEFSGFELHGEGDGIWITAEPNSPSLPYSQVEFLITDQDRIGRMRITTDDLSILDFTFSDEKINPPLVADLFTFHLPAGAELDDNSQ